MALKRNLTQGTSGSDVKEMQNALTMLGYSVGSAGADGVYGPATAAAVAKFQQANNLKADGIVGIDTYNALTQSLMKAGVIAPGPLQTALPKPSGSGEVVLHGGGGRAIPPIPQTSDSQIFGMSWTTIGLIAAGAIAFMMIMGEEK